MKGPEPAAALRGFMAVVTDMVRVDPERRPTAEMQRWHRDIAAHLGALPPLARTNRELFESGLRMRTLLSEGAAPAEDLSRAA